MELRAALTFLLSRAEEDVSALPERVIADKEEGVWDTPSVSYATYSRAEGLIYNVITIAEAEGLADVVEEARALLGKAQIEYYHSGE
jgi:hypothetical protein